MVNIDNLIKESLKNGDKDSLRAYRNLKTEFQKVKTSKNAPEWTEKQEIKTIQNYVKSLEKSVEEFKQAGREDLILEYSNELSVLKKLLPEPVSEREIYQELDKYLFKHDFPIKDDDYYIPKKETGKVIKYLKDTFPTADGQLIAKIVKSYE